MSVRKQRSTQTATGAWAANSTIQTNLDRKGALTRIYVTVEVTPSATIGSTGFSIPGGPWRNVQNLTVAGGGQVYFTLPADNGCVEGSLLHYLNMYDGFGVGHPNSVITAPRATYTPFTYVFHAGTRPKDMYGRSNPFDLTAFIPAVAEGQLRLDWVTSGNDVMDETITVTSATLRVTLCHVMGNEAELLEEMAAQGVIEGLCLPPGVKAMVPAWTAERYVHDGTYTAFSAERNAPTGGWLSHVVMADQDETATRTEFSSDETIGVAVKINREGYNIIEARVESDQADLPMGDALVAADVADLGGASPFGIFIKDLTRHQHTPWGREYGFNMGAPGVGTGDLKTGQTINTYTAGDDTLFIWRRRLAVSPETRIP